LALYKYLIDIDIDIDIAQNIRNQTGRLHAWNNALTIHERSGKLTTPTYSDKGGWGLIDEVPNS